MRRALDSQPMTADHLLLSLCDDNCVAFQSVLATSSLQSTASIPARPFLTLLAFSSAGVCARPRVFLPDLPVSLLLCSILFCLDLKFVASQLSFTTVNRRLPTAPPGCSTSQDPRE